MSEFIEHYGIPRKSGRYKWGSGADPYHHGQAMPSGAKKIAKTKVKIKKLDTKIATNESKITDLTNRRESDKRVQKARVKAQKEQYKVAKYAKAADRAKRNAARGKKSGVFTRVQADKYNQAQVNIKYGSRYEQKYNQKIAKLDYKNFKNERKREKALTRYNKLVAKYGQPKS